MAIAFHLRSRSESVAASGWQRRLVRSAPIHFERSWRLGTGCKQDGFLFQAVGRFDGQSRITILVSREIRFKEIVNICFSSEVNLDIE